MQNVKLDELRKQHADVDKAFWYAIRAHKGQLRKDGKTPYIVHPMEVAEIAGTMTADSRVMAAALLHDVVEDTPVKMHDLVRVFGVHIADLVADVTENKRSDQPAEETWQKRKKELVFKIASAGREAKIISLSDKLSNLRSIKRDLQENGDIVWTWFHQDKSKQAWYYKTMREQYTGLKSTAAWKQYDSLIKEIFE